MRNCSLSLLAAVAGVSLFAQAARSQTLYLDQFSTSGSLNGTKPNTSFNNATWTALGGVAGPSSNGSVLSVPTTVAQTNTLDLGSNYFSTHAGVYTLSMDVNIPAGSGSPWLALGFVTNPVTGGTLSSTASNSGLNPNGGTNGGSPWMLDRQNGQVNVYGGNGTNSNFLSSSVGAFPGGTTYTMKLVLDTSVANWTLDAYMGSTQLDLNGASAGNTRTFTTNPTDIRYVGFSFSPSGGSIGTITADNFSLALAAVPEPSPALLVGAGVVAIFGFRRIRRAA